MEVKCDDLFLPNNFTRQLFLEYNQITLISSIKHIHTSYTCKSGFVLTFKFICFNIWIIDVYDFVDNFIQGVE